MPYVIKRYANRKLYDTQSKRYLTLDEVGILVRAGEQVQVVDADNGEDITGHVLSKIIAEGSRREGGLVPQNLLVEWIQRPGEAVVDAVKTSVSVGQRTVEQLGGELARVLGGLLPREGRQAAAKTKQAAEGLARVIEDRLRMVVTELDLVRRSDLERLEARITALETLASRVAALEVAAANQGEHAAPKVAPKAAAKAAAKPAAKPVGAARARRATPNKATTTGGAANG